jgi:predicted dehydrogenase
MSEISLALKMARITAVCDVSEAAATRAQRMVEKMGGTTPAPYTRGPEDYKRMLERQDVDAVLIMTPQNVHAQQSIDAMLAGKHVGSETPTAYTVEDNWRLVETKEKTGRRFMLLENYPYARTRMMILNMAHGGAMGEITYGESSYIHDTRNLAFEKDGTPSWRGQIARGHRGDVYPTHGLGPIALWMGVNRGDRLATMFSMDSGTKSFQSYAAEAFGKEHPAAKPGYFQRHDNTITLVRTENEKLIVLRYDPGSNRPAGGWEALQGTKGSYDGSPSAELVYLEGRSPQHKWEPLAKYRDQYDHPWWKDLASQAEATGHGGGDYFVMREFYRALIENREPPIDVYDGAAWSSMLPLSAKAIQEGKAQEVPDYTRGKYKMRKLEGFGI